MLRTCVITTVILAFLSSTPKNVLLGRWETKPSVNGNVTGVVFKADSSYEAYINKKPFVSGRYIIKDSLVSIKENGCQDYVGTYRLVFFSHADSLRLVPVTDSCQQRREGMSRTILGRVK